MARCCQGDRDLLCEGHQAQTDIRLNEGPVPQLDTLEQGFSCLVAVEEVLSFLHGTEYRSDALTSV